MSDTKINTPHNSHNFAEQNNYQKLSPELSAIFSREEIQALRRFYFINPAKEKNYSHLLKNSDEKQLLKDYVFHNSKTKENYVLIKDTIANSTLLRPTHSKSPDKKPGSTTNEDMLESSFTAAFKNALVKMGKISQESAKEIDREAMLDLIGSQYLKTQVNKNLEKLNKNNQSKLEPKDSWINADLLKNEYKLVQMMEVLQIDDELYRYVNLVREHLPKGEAVWKATFFTDEQLGEDKKITDTDLRKMMHLGKTIRFNRQGQIVDKNFELDMQKNTDGSHLNAVYNLLEFFINQNNYTLENDNKNQAAPSLEEFSSKQEENPTEATGKVTPPRVENHYIGILKINPTHRSASDLIKQNIQGQISSKNKSELKNWTEDDSRSSSFNKIPQGHKLRQALVINSLGKTASEVDPNIYPVGVPYRFVAENHGLIAQVLNNPKSAEDMDTKLKEAMKNEEFIKTYVKSQNIRTIISTVFSNVLKDFGMYSEGISYPATVALQKHIFADLDIIISDLSRGKKEGKLYDHWIVEFTPDNDQLQPAIQMLQQELTENAMKYSLNKEIGTLKPRDKATILQKFISEIL